MISKEQGLKAYRLMMSAKAMANIYDLVRRNKMQYTPAIQKRIAALYSAQVRLGKAGKI